MTNEEIISNFLKRPEEGGGYTDERLTMLLAHAQDGKLAYGSCCCLLGVPTADHALKGRTFQWTSEPHFLKARAAATPLAFEAEEAFARLAEFDDEARRAKLIPLIEAEMKRRETLNAPAREYGELAREPSEVFAAFNYKILI